ncbi:MAG: CPBP family intramembrane glutamic endopeptidase [Candidatus Micrarchaeota archaeon]
MKLFFLILSVLSFLLFLFTIGCQLSGAGFCSAISDYFVYSGSASIHLGLFSLAMFFLWKKDLRSTMCSIGLPGNIRDNLFYSAMTLSAIFLVLFCLGVAAIVLKFNDQQKVSDKITSLPTLVLLFAVVGAPLTEELFFRAFLVPRTGIVISAIVFGLLHFAYGSVVEVLGALVIGLVLGASYKFSKSVAPCMLAHLLYNAISITVITSFSG